MTGSANFAAEEIIFTSYVVQQEDTLYRLTEKFDTSIELMARFTIASDDFIVGNTLSVPIANPDRCPGMRPYVVREHETVYRIATAFGTTPPTVQSINGLDANLQHPHYPSSFACLYRSSPFSMAVFVTLTKKPFGTKFGLW